VARPRRIAPPADKSSSKRTDGTLIRRYRGGEDAAATSIYLKYARRLRALAEQHCRGELAGRFDADDVVQSVFRTFFEGVRKQAYDVPEGGEIWGLLMVLALNKVRNLADYHKARKRDVRQTTPLPKDPRHLLAKDGDAAVFLKMVLDEQMAGLPESNRRIIRMRIEGYEISEIASGTGRSRRTVERVLQDFRGRLSKP
jgi:RNA polymerase sigma-70 factor (ECF subfamily)